MAKLTEKEENNANLEESSKPKDVFGLIYSVYGELGPKPIFFFPETLTSDMAVEILLRSTCFISIDFQKMNDKITNFPFPEYNLQGITYFYEEKTDSPGSLGMASITLLINDELSVFVNRNIENLKENLHILSQDLKNKKELQKRLLSKYYNNLMELIGGYKSVQILTDESSETKEYGKKAVLLSYFHAKMGPVPFYCYPDILDEDRKNKVSRELEMNISTGFFTRSYPDFVVLHNYFELSSEFARGKTEMCLISFIFDKIPSKEMLNNISFHFVEALDTLSKKKNAALGFYKDGYKNLDRLDKIDEMKAYLQHWVRDLHKKCFEKNNEKND